MVMVRAYLSLLLKWRKWPMFYRAWRHPHLQDVMYASMKPTFRCHLDNARILLQQRSKEAFADLQVKSELKELLVHGKGKKLVIAVWLETKSGMRHFETFFPLDEAGKVWTLSSTVTDLEHTDTRPSEYTVHVFSSIKEYNEHLEQHLDMLENFAASYT